MLVPLLALLCLSGESHAADPADTRAAAKAAALATNGPGDAPGGLLRDYAALLEQAGLPLCAARYFAATQAVPELVRIARRTGDWTEVDRIAGGPADPWPVAGRDTLALRAGLLQYHHGHDAEALATLALVPRGSADYPEARYLAAVALNGLGSREDARAAFAEVAGLADPGRLRDLSLLNAARVDYALGRFTQALAGYAQIGARSPYRAEATLEAAWAAYRADDTAALDKDLAALEGPLGRDAWVPERHVLRATYAFEYLHPDEITPAVAALHATVDPVRAQLAAASPEALLLLGPASPLPVPLVADFRRDPAVADALRTLDQVAAEEKALQKGKFRDEAAGLDAYLETVRAAATARVAERLTQLLQREKRSLDDLSRRGDIVLFEQAAGVALGVGEPPPTEAERASAREAALRIGQALLPQMPPADRAGLKIRLFHLGSAGKTPSDRVAGLQELLAEGPPGEELPGLLLDLALAQSEAGDRAGERESLRQLAQGEGAVDLLGRSGDIVGDLLMEVGDPAAAKEAYLTMKGPISGHVRVKIAKCKAAVGDRDGAVADLRTLLDHPDPLVRELARYALDEVQRR